MTRNSLANAATAVLAICGSKRDLQKISLRISIHIQDKEQPDAPIDLVIPTTDLELANVIFERLFGSLEKLQEERSPKKESRLERSSDDTGSSSPTSRKNSKNERPSIGEQLQSFREKLSGVEPRVPAREKMHSEITK